MPVAAYWKGAVVAVKVIVHNASMARKVDTLRESLVGISMQHQHVVRPLSMPPCRHYGILFSGLPVTPSMIVLSCEKRTRQQADLLQVGGDFGLPRFLGGQQWLLFRHMSALLVDRCHQKGRAVRSSLCSASVQMTTYKVMTTMKAEQMDEVPDARYSTARRNGYSVAHLGPGNATKQEMLETWLLLEVRAQRPCPLPVASCPSCLPPMDHDMLSHHDAWALCMPLPASNS